MPDLICPKHGVLNEDDLLEGHDGTMHGSEAEGDGYTGEYFCGLHHEGERPRVIARAALDKLGGDDG